jgi:peptidoglycan/xylan/chitin deacetylase (PgdA/CDA1 family)
MELKFPLHGSAEAVCREFLLRDMARARLSRVMQAYYRLRPVIPIWLRQLLQRRRGGTFHVGPEWYLPREFCDRIAAVLNDDRLAVVRSWPGDKTYAFVLTHDVETSDGMRQIDAVARIEEEMGFRSSWNIVPFKYPVDQGLLADLRQRGFEIGIHGYNHDGRLFESESTFLRRAAAINAALERFGAVGFRAPMVHRNLSWMQWLDIQYDSSCFDVDPFQAMPGGIGSLWPVVVGRFVEMPYTLPQDHTLLIGLGETNDRIWRHKLSFIKAWRGMALMLTHPDYLHSPKTREIYRGFLSAVRETDEFWHALPRDVARWWVSPQGLQAGTDGSPQRLPTRAGEMATQEHGRHVTHI